MKKFTCIVCPVSCNLEVTDNNNELTVKGNQCKRGVAFGINEYKDPKRMLTTTVKVLNSKLKRVPVISSAEVPKNRLIELVQLLYKESVEAPITRGDIVVKNIGDTGVDIIASRTIR